MLSSLLSAWFVLTLTTINLITHRSSSHDRCSQRPSVRLYHILWITGRYPGSWLQGRAGSASSAYLLVLLHFRREPVSLFLKSTSLTAQKTFVNLQSWQLPFSRSLCGLLTRMLKINPNDRPTIEEVMHDPWLRAPYK